MTREWRGSLAKPGLLRGLAGGGQTQGLQHISWAPSLTSCLSFLIGKKGTGIAPLCPVIMSRMRCLRESSLPGGCPVFSLVLTGTPEQVLLAAGFRKGTEGGGMTRAEPRGTGSVFLPRNPERVFPGRVSQKGTQKFQFPFSSPLPPLNPPTSICRQCTVTVTVCMGLSTARRF